MRVLVDGAQRAMTRGRVGKASISSSVMASNSEAALTREVATECGREARLVGMMPTSLAMASAVDG